MGTKTRMLLAVATALATVQLATAPAWAFGMCGSFRLKDLLKQAETILVLEFSDANADGLARAKVVKVFKGDANLPAVKSLKVDFLAMGPQLSIQGKEVMARIAKGNRQAVLFSGVFDTKAGPEETPDTEEARVKGFLYVAGKWVALERSSDGVWDMERICEFLNGVWCGGTDMLIRAVEYLQSDPEADLPMSPGNEWDFAGIARIGRIAGRAFAAAPVDLRGKGACDLFVAAEKGDRVFRFDGAAWRDITGALKLASRSRIHAWGDFDGDGCLDLAELKGVIEKVDASLVEDASQGQQAGCLGDFNGDGAMDMALVLANSDVCVFPRKVTNDRPAMGLRLGLTPGAEHVGPVSVTVSLRTGPSEGRTSGSGTRNLGCWTVPAGGEPVLIGTRPGSVVQLQWRWPGGEPVICRVKVRDAFVPVALDSAKP